MKFDLSDSRSSKLDKNSQTEHRAGNCLFGSSPPVHKLTKDKQAYETSDPTLKNKARRRVLRLEVWALGQKGNPGSEPPGNSLLELGGPSPHFGKTGKKESWRFLFLEAMERFQGILNWDSDPAFL